MKMEKTIPIAVALTLVLGALPAAAKKRGHDRREARIERLAHDLHEAAASVYAGAFETRRYRCHRYWRAVSALERLDRNARRFHATVEREGPHDRDTRRAFQRLERSYGAARHTLPRLRGKRRLHRDFARVERLMHRIDDRLAQHPGQHRGYDRSRHRAYDRSRHRGRDHWRYGDRSDDRHGRWYASWAFGF